MCSCCYYTVCFNAAPNRWMGSWRQKHSTPTWGWHSHNGYTLGARGLLPPGILATYTKQMAQINPSKEGAAEESWHVTVCRCACYLKQALIIGIELLTEIPSSVCGPWAIYWDCMCVWECVLGLMSSHCQWSTVPWSTEVAERVSLQYPSAYWLSAEMEAASFNWTGSWSSAGNMVSESWPGLSLVTTCLCSSVKQSDIWTGQKEWRL